MVKRVISALVGALILLIVYVLKSNIVFNIVATLIAIIGIGEFYYAIKQNGVKPIETVGYISCLFLLAVGFVSNEKVLLPFLVMFMPLLVFALFSVSIFTNMKYKFVDIACTILGILYVPMMMLFLMLTWYMENGHLLIWFIFCGAWISDIFAYLVGITIGKHKFSKISPKKSVEGCIGGVLGSAIFYGVYSYYLNTSFIGEFGGETFPIAVMVFLGALVSVISQIGDFSASAVKRCCNIKDFGSIMPGHGGILDRFDSIFMISPFVFALLEFWI